MKEAITLKSQKKRGFRLNRWATAQEVLAIINSFTDQKYALIFSLMGFLPILKLLFLYCSMIYKLFGMLPIRNILFFHSMNN